MRRWQWVPTVLVLALLLGTGTAVASSHEDQFAIVQVAVRQGDATVFRGPCGELGLFDTNRGRAEEVLMVLDELGTRALEWIAVSHYDSDHLGGIVDVATAEGVSVETAHDRGGDRDERDTDTYHRYFDWATSDATTRRSLDIGDTFSLCQGDQEVVFEVVSAGTDGTAAGGVEVTEENDKGLCLKISFRTFIAASCGDVNGRDEGGRADVESAVAPAIGKVHFAKLNHHGSRFSSNASFVETLAPTVAVVSTGRNSFGHPDPDVIARWEQHADVYRTQGGDNEFVDGNVTVSTDGISFFTVTTSASGVTMSYSLDPSARCPGFEALPGNHVVGTAGDDTIAGSEGPDVLCGLGGDDELLGLGNDDILVGGLGEDAVAGGSGDDAIIGGEGEDTLDGGPGLDACEIESGDPALVRCDEPLVEAGQPEPAPEPEVRFIEKEGDGVFGSGILDVTIGLILVYLVLSLIGSAVNEALAAVLRSRARFLRQGIESLLGGGLTRQFYGHPLVENLKKGTRDPSYIPSRTFALVLLDRVLPRAVGPTGDRAEEPSLAELEEEIDRIEFDPIKQPLKLLLREAGGKLDEFRGSVEDWFNDAMDRVSGWYKRHTQLVLAVIAFVIVGLSNADTVQIARALWNSESLRETVVAEAEARAAEEAAGATEAEEAAGATGVEEEAATGAEPSSDQGAEEEAFEELTEEVGTLTRLQLPLGWSFDPDDPRWVGGEGWVAVTASWIAEIFGLALTTAALTLGAPFWFDLLKKFVGVRSSGPPSQQRSRKEEK